jgi:geranylgeranyl pyrophosphate synthase
LASNKKAVLAGDYLLSKVIVDLCAAGNLELVSLMSKVIKDLSEGEWLQLDLMVTRNYTREAILEVAKMKTSSVMSYCTVAPAILAAESKEVINAASNFGVHLGIAFQLIDDTLDFSASSDKDAFLDLENNVVNAVFYEYLESRSGLIERFKKGEDLNKLINLNEIQESVDIVVKRAHEHLEMALNNLSIIEKSLKQKYSEKEIDEAVEYLRLIVAFLVLRKN